MTVRIGILGAARIAPKAVLEPARRVPGAEVVAVAARDPQRAARFARRYAIPHVHPDYTQLIADPAVNVVYNALPNHLHGAWTIAALHAGKHVLCEKPLAANYTEAQQIAQAAYTTNRLVMEAFHYRYHPAFLRILQLVAGGELGPLRHLEAHFCVPLVRLGDIRYRFDLAGGATMDLGCYAVHMLRTVAGREPDVLQARARRLWRPLDTRVDRRMDAELAFPAAESGHAPISAQLSASLLSSTPLRVQLIVTGENGEARLWNPVLPHKFHRVRVRRGTHWQTEHFGHTTTYIYQMQALIEAIATGQPPPTDVLDGLANMRVLDDIYRRAGLPLRQPASLSAAAPGSTVGAAQ